MKKIISLITAVLLVFITGCSSVQTGTKTAQSTSLTANDENVCYLTIECKSILENSDKLKAGHEKYVPKDGYILNKYECKYSSGDTAYDILKSVCSKNNIKLTTQKTQYGIYISGINNIDEFDCGKESGWLYSVNATTPEISYGDYEIKAKDNITFYYICSYQFD